MLSRGIPVSYSSKQGTYFGKLISTAHTDIIRLKKQIYASDDDEFTFSLAKVIIRAKINNQLVVARRYAKDDQEQFDELKQIKYYKDKVEYAKTSEELMGYEGIAAKTYFDVLSKEISQEFSFSGRSRRPPKDPFNSMLSLGYTMLMNEIYGEIENKGLSAY